MSNRYHITSVVMVVVLGVLLFNALAMRSSSFDPKAVGLGLNTTDVHSADFDGLRVAGRPADAAVLIQEIADLHRRGTKVALWLGASQLHALNEAKPGDQLAVVYANQRARGRGSPMAYLQMSAPNANLHEILGCYLAFVNAGQVPDRLIIPVTYDDLQETGIRQEVLDLAKNVPDDVVKCGEGGVRDLLTVGAEMAQPASDESPVKRNAMSGTPQEWLENNLVKSIEYHWPAYRYRDKLRAETEVVGTSLLIAAVFKVSQRPVVQIPPDMQAYHMRALDSIIALTKAQGVKLLLYKPPHRPGEKKFYYDRAAYDLFFAQLKQRCAKEGIDYADLELIVPSEYWGRTNTGLPDVFHFSDYGHRQLGAAIDSFLEKARN